MPPEYRAVTKSVAFRLDAPHAKRVSVVILSAKGDKTSTRGMRQAVDGVWHATVELPRGRWLYRLLVDDVPTLDPSSRGTVKDATGGDWSMREVGH